MCVCRHLVGSLETGHRGRFRLNSLQFPAATWATSQDGLRLLRILLKNVENSQCTDVYCIFWYKKYMAIDKIPLFLWDVLNLTEIFTCHIRFTEDASNNSLCRFLCLKEFQQLSVKGGEAPPLLSWPSERPEKYWSVNLVHRVSALVDALHSSNSGFQMIPTHLCPALA